MVAARASVHPVIAGISRPSWWGRGCRHRDRKADQGIASWDGPPERPASSYPQA